MEGSQTGLIVDTAHDNLLSLNHVTGAGDGMLIAGDRNNVAGNLVDAPWAAARAAPATGSASPSAPATSSRPTS